MSIAKPFTFVANTYAKATEVNADLDVAYSQINTNISNIAKNAVDINNLDNNKANINGSSVQRFAVADPLTAADAVNKQSMMNAITNSLDYISGLYISKDSGSPNDTIIVTAGSCYDSTHSVMLKLDSSTSKQNLNQGASTTYYVYIIGNDSGSSIDILISQNSDTPSLPAGYTKYRQIGLYTTDSNGYIDIITNHGNSLPDASAVIISSYVSGTSGWILYSNKLCIQWGRLTTSGQGHNKNINLHKTYANTNYNILLQQYGGGNSAAEYQNIQFVEAGSITASKFQIFNGPYSSAIHWRTYGYVA